MSYNPRLTEPSSNDLNWIHTSKGGKNSCILITGNSVLPNCVGYAWGRFMEVLGSTPKLARTNAENWYNYNDGYERGQEPKLGAVICFAKGQAGVSSDGAGHVAIVEQINSDGSIVTSNSDYGGRRFFTRIFTKPYSMRGYTFQGFIYNPAVKDEVKCETVNKLYLPASASSWRVYDLGVQPIKKNAKAFLKPSKFGGLTYDILGWSMKDVAIIETRDFGRVQIYVAPSTGAIIK